MIIKVKIRDEKWQCYINRQAAKISLLSSEKFINMNTLQVKKYYFLIKEERLNKLSF